MRDHGPIVGLIEDDPVMGESLVDWFRVEGWKPVWWRNGRDALVGLRRLQPDAILCDIRLPDMTGEDVLKEVGDRLGNVPVVIITGFGNIEQAVRLVQAGAIDYVTKPFDAEALIKKLTEVVKSRRASVESATLGVSAAIVEVERTLRRVAPLDSTILLNGPSGSGKEVAARFLHAHSPRAQEPFLAVNCAAVPETAFESDTFGHEKGAFAGARARHRGFVERAGSGTLFLDEISALPLELQPTLLRLIEERVYTRVGGGEQQPFRARIIAATNADIENAVKAGRFREDLYYRLAVIHIELPNLGKRADDIMPLANQFVVEFATAFGREVRGIAPAAEAALKAHAWPGNIRELRNRTERAVALSNGKWLTLAELFPERTSGRANRDADVLPLADARDAAERRMIEIALSQCHGDVEQAADLLRVSRSTMFAKIRKLGVRATP